MSAELYRDIPELLNSPHRLTSAMSTRYNCIAWAAGDTRRWWWPDRMRVNYWPRAHREETLDAFLTAFGDLGYSPCESGDAIFGIEKVAIFAKGNSPTHAARQLPDGTWTSKCGTLEDVSHVLEGVRGTLYGVPALFMSRELPPIWKAVNSAFAFQAPSAASSPPIFRVKRTLHYAPTGSVFSADGLIDIDLLRRIGVALPFQTLVRVGTADCTAEYDFAP